jgi:hypothetical protein
MLNAPNFSHILIPEIDELLEKMKRPSERERKARSFKDNGDWKAEDYKHFILSMVGLICSQRRFLPDIKLYKVLCFLSNLVYLMYNPRFTDALLPDLERNMALFVDVYHERIGIGGCTWKFHVFQHFIELLKRHGSALFWDGFFRECVVGELKNYLTGTRGEDEQVVCNFLLTHHARRYFDSCEASPRMKEFYDRETRNFSGKSLSGNSAFRYETVPDIREEERTRILGMYCATRDRGVKRVLRFNHGGTILTSEKNARRGMVDDSWVFLRENLFGRVQDIFVVDGEERESFVFKIEKYRKVPVMDEMSMEGDELMFPMNQFPSESMNEYEYVKVDESVRVQKMSVGTYTHSVGGDLVDLVYFSVWNEHV